MNTVDTLATHTSQDKVAPDGWITREYGFFEWAVPRQVWQTPLRRWCSGRLGERHIAESGNIGSVLNVLPGTEVTEHAQGIRPCRVSVQSSLVWASMMEYGTVKYTETWTGRDLRVKAAFSRRTVLAVESKTVDAKEPDGASRRFAEKPVTV